MYGEQTKTSSSTIIQVDEEEDNGKEESVDKIIKIKNKYIKKRKTKKKIGLGKKSQLKKKKISVLKPVGRVRPEPSADDAAVALNSRGDPLNETTGDGISFVDKEQEMERINARPENVRPKIADLNSEIE